LSFANYFHGVLRSILAGNFLFFDGILKRKRFSSFIIFSNRTVDFTGWLTRYIGLGCCDYRRMKESVLENAKTGSGEQAASKSFGFMNFSLLHACFYLIPRLTMSGSIPPFPNALWAYTGTHFENKCNGWKI
jgi:hypothetical protein